MSFCFTVNSPLAHIQRGSVLCPTMTRLSLTLGCLLGLVCSSRAELSSETKPMRPAFFRHDFDVRKATDNLKSQVNAIMHDLNGARGDVNPMSVDDAYKRLTAIDRDELVPNSLVEALQRRQALLATTAP